MEKLETLIQELYQEGTREKNMEVLSQIRKLAKEQKQFIIPVGDANGEKVYRRLSLDEWTRCICRFYDAGSSGFGSGYRNIKSKCDGCTPYGA